MLVEAHGELVSKDAIMRQVWSESQDIENRANSLKVQVSALRKALGRDRKMIKTISGRGYRLIGEISVEANMTHVPEFPIVPQPSLSLSTATNLPNPVSDLFGRDVALVEVIGLLKKHRIVTLTGAGGIGKTKLGLEVARQARANFADGVWLTELAALSNEKQVFDAVATALGLTLAGGIPSPDLVARAIGARQLLVMLDNCEHVLDAAAAIAEVMVRTNPQICVLATSREPLRVDGEWTYRVSPLGVPPQGSDDAGDALQHDAVQLFVARARAIESRFVPDTRGATIAANICRRLDGVPLAIELAATRVGTMSLESLDARLSDRFSLLTNGRRTALPQHRTLRATLDWSYNMLPENERAVLRRLATFAGSFTLEAASIVTADAEISASEVANCIMNMVAKSLVATELRGSATDLRLLETMRAYAAEKLVESGEFEQVSRRHAEYYRKCVLPAAPRQRR
jgi:predicted ATPase/DNA-binding winged helix-turn-helix (wHTH) protein